jgi:hypothetical protein
VNADRVELKLHMGEKEDKRREFNYSAPTCPFCCCGHKAPLKQQPVLELPGESGLGDS